MLVELLQAAGCEVDGPQVVADGDPVEKALRDGVKAGYDVIVTTGGTGLTPLDLTPEMTRKVIDREVPGIADAVRWEGDAAGFPPRSPAGVAGLDGRTLIVNLPGSTGGVRDGVAVVSRVLPHAIDQAGGGDHPRQAESQRWPGREEGGGRCVGGIG